MVLHHVSSRPLWSSTRSSAVLSFSTTLMTYLFASWNRTCEVNPYGYIHKWGYPHMGSFPMKKRSFCGGSRLCTNIPTRQILWHVEVNPHENTLASHVHVIDAQLRRHCDEGGFVVLRFHRFFEPKSFAKKRFGLSCEGKWPEHLPRIGALLEKMACARLFFKDLCIALRNKVPGQQIVQSQIGSLKETQLCKPRYTMPTLKKKEPLHVWAILFFWNLIYKTESFSCAQNRQRAASATSIPSLQQAFPFNEPLGPWSFTRKCQSACSATGWQILGLSKRDGRQETGYDRRHDAQWHGWNFWVFRAVPKHIWNSAKFSAEACLSSWFGVFQANVRKLSNVQS